LAQTLDRIGIDVQLSAADDPAMKLVEPLLQQETYGDAAVFAVHVFDAVEAYCMQRGWHLGELPARRWMPPRSVTVRIDDPTASQPRPQP
jgi:hypothetical protein